MGSSRKGWQNAKSQLGAAWGDDFVRSNFKQDLGPVLDQIDNELERVTSELKELEKSVDAVVARKMKVLGQIVEARSKLESYGKIVKNKSRAEKTKHGEQWDDLLDVLERGFMKEYNDMNNSLRTITEKLKKVVWVSS